MQTFMPSSCTIRDTAIYDDNGAWYLGRGSNNLLAPAELFRVWQESASGQSGEAVLIIISDSCYSGHWVAAAERAQLSNVAVQSATGQNHKSFDDENTGGLFTYKVYNCGSFAFQSVFSITGFFYCLWLWNVDNVQRSSQAVQRNRRVCTFPTILHL